jgi:hypothetical protein
MVIRLTFSRATPASKSLERPLAVASELMSAPPPKALDAISEDNVTISSPEPNNETQDEKVRLPCSRHTKLISSLRSLRLLLLLMTHLLHLHVTISGNTTTPVLAGSRSLPRLLHRLHLSILLLLLPRATTRRHYRQLRMVPESLLPLLLPS